MSKSEFSPDVFVSAPELDRAVNSRDLSKFAIWALTFINKDKGLSRTNSGKSVYWLYEKPDFEHYERAAFSVTHDRGDNDRWLLKYRYLSQKYPEIDKSHHFEYSDMSQFEEDFGENTRTGEDWKTGELTTYKATWSKQSLLELKQSAIQVPSQTIQEIDTVNDLLITDIVNKENIGERNYKIVSEIRDMDTTDASVIDTVWLSDLQAMKNTITRMRNLRLERTDAENERLQKSRERRRRKSSRYGQTSTRAA